MRIREQRAASLEVQASRGVRAITVQANHSAGRISAAEIANGAPDRKSVV
jgi:hypothetical protein